MSCARHLVLLLALFCVPLAGCSKEEPPPQCDADSKEFGVAEGCRITGSCTWDPKFQTCVVGSDADCAQSEVCKKSGKCTKVGRLCKPATDGHCRASEECKTRGLCSAQSGACKTGSDADCAVQECKKEGACKYDAKKGCVVDSAESCAQSDDCKRYGSCSYFEDALESGTVSCCGAARHADCKGSTWCAEDGHCFLRGYAMNDPNRPEGAGRYCNPDRAHESKTGCVTKETSERWAASEAKEKEEASRRPIEVDTPSSDGGISDDEMAEALSDAIRGAAGFGSDDDDDESLLETVLEAAVEAAEE